MFKRIYYIILIFIFMSIIPVLAGYEMIKTQITRDDARFIGKVFLNDILVCKFYSEDELNLKLKINNIAARLDKLVSDSVKTQDIKCVAGPREAIIKTNKDILFTVNAAELTPGEYSFLPPAKEYLENLKKALNSLPDIKFSQNIIIIPRGKSVRVKITGAENDRYTMEEYDESVIEITEKTSDYIEIKGVALGSTPLYFVYPPLKKLLVVGVKEMAGHLPAGLRVNVTGNPATADVIKEAVLQNLRQNISAKHKVHTNIDDRALRSVGSLYPGKTRAVTIPVSLSGENFIPVKKGVSVQIENKPMALNNTSYLLVSDRPETILNNGKLFESKLLDYGSHRLLFHHKCYEYSYPRKLEARIINDSSESSFVYVIRGFVHEYNELYAGFYGGKKFFENLLGRRGYVVEVKPNSKLSVLSENLKPGEIVSGLINFQVIRGALPKIIMQSSTYRHSNYFMYDLSEGKKVHPRGTFPNPDLELKYQHNIGEAYTFIDIGNTPFLKEITTGEPCYGNYGAFYYLDISIVNKYPYEKDCEILFQARAGPARAVFVIDGSLFVVSNTVYFPNELLLKKYRLGPHQTKKVKILTFPMAGINYPVVVLVKSFKNR